MGVILPPGLDLEILEGKIKSAELLEHIKHHDTKMAQSILAQFLQLGQEGGGGSFALSRDQSDFFLMSLLSCGNSICDTINRYAVPQLIDYNFTVRKYPQLAMKLSTIDVPKLTEGLSKLVTGKVVLPDNELEDFIRDLLGLPVVAEDREVREVSTAPALLFEKVKTEEKAKKFTEKKGKFKRALTKYEQGVKFQEIEDRFDKAEKALKKVMIEKPPEPVHEIKKWNVTIDEQMEYISKKLEGGTQISFIELMKELASKIRIVVTFIGMLEMVKAGKIGLRESKSLNDFIIYGFVNG
jgi:chromatin segregation and condensation protein Rec8/ScpA/Scc1 (kleisin family)